MLLFKVLALVKPNVDTLAINPPFTRSNQFASYNLGPIRKFKSVILSSSLTSVAAVGIMRKIHFLNKER